MRNSKWFELNVFDEQTDGLSLSVISQMPMQARESLSLDQKYIIESDFFKRLSKAYDRWNGTMCANNFTLTDLFKKRNEPEFKSAGFEPFRSGAYWQILEYLDGPHPVKSKEIKAKYPDRATYQDDLFMNENKELLQTAWDLAINSALLCDYMPRKSASGNKGSVYLLERVVLDKDSMFYPSVTNRFQKRVVNEAFWQCICDLSHDNEYEVLEEILTRNNSDLETSCAKDNILRWNGSNRFSHICERSEPLVTGYSGNESFRGISPRAVENYGSFLNKLHKDFSYEDKELLLPFAKMYVDAVNCKDEDGINYFNAKGEKEKLLSLEFIEYHLGLKEYCKC